MGVNGAVKSFLERSSIDFDPLQHDVALVALRRGNPVHVLVPARKGFGRG